MGALLLDLRILIQAARTRAAFLFLCRNPADLFVTFVAIT